MYRSRRHRLFLEMRRVAHLGGREPQCFVLFVEFSTIKLSFTFLKLNQTPFGLTSIEAVMKILRSASGNTTVPMFTIYHSTSGACNKVGPCKGSNLTYYGLFYDQALICLLDRYKESHQVDVFVKDPGSFRLPS